MAEWLETVGRMVLAALLGGIIGWEREVHEKPAGLRTLMLVSLAAAIYVIAAQGAAQAHQEALDSVRAMTGVAQGIGFLGAGVILQSRRKVLWLTTAAALWAAAALGLSAGLGMYTVAIVGGLLVFVILRWLPIAEDRWIRREASVSPENDGESQEAEEGGPE